VEERAAVYRAHPQAGRTPLARVLRRLPAPRLTGLGCGVLGALAMLLIGGLDRLVLGPPVPCTACFSCWWPRPAGSGCGPPN
ncbi:DUF6542 domain-containing protein, partial [Streptomyces sp. URMC 123]